MIKPVRIQRSRQHKQESPNGLPIVYVGRPGKWGNPYITGTSAHLTIKEAITLYEKYIKDWNLEEEIKKELKGKNLSCWCPLEQKCHADVLLKIANE